MEQAKRVVHLIAPQVSMQQSKSEEYRQKRVVAYCRVSTKEEEQLNSYEAQLAYYTEYIRKNPDWSYAGIYADKGITGTSVKRRDEFNKMIRLCKKGRVDMIITKSVSRFARNTVDCLKNTRLLKSLGVDVYFEEQGIHSTQPGAEFYITIYGSIAQSESENISENVKWGKAQSAKEGKVPFAYKNFLGYEKGPDGTPVINEEQAKTVRFIYERFLAGDSMQTISRKLMEKKVLTPAGKEYWAFTTIRSILTNEKYMGDAIINKTYVVDCLSKKTKVNKGERAKYYVENNHPAIIDKLTFGKVQEELAKRRGKPKPNEKVITQGKYSSKYALSELIVCGECKTPYRRSVWRRRNGKLRYVWRCKNRIDFGNRYCHESPTIDESAIHSALMSAIKDLAQGSGTVVDTLKLHIAMGLDIQNGQDEENSIMIRLKEIQVEIRKMISEVSANMVESFYDTQIQSLALEQAELQTRLEEIRGQKEKQAIRQSRLEDIYTIVDGLKNHPLEYDDELIRQMIDTIVVLSKDKIRIVFKGGLEIDQLLEE